MYKNQRSLNFKGEEFNVKNNENEKFQTWQ